MTPPTDVAIAELRAADQSIGRTLDNHAKTLADHESRLRPVERVTAQLAVISALAGIAGSALGATVSGVVVYMVTH